MPSAQSAPSLEFVLQRRGIASSRETSEAAARCELHGGDLTTSLLQFVDADEAQLSAALSDCHRLPAAPLGLLPASPESSRVQVPREVAERYCCFPLEHNGGCLTLVVAEPLDPGVREELSFALGVDIKERIALEVRIRQAVARDYGVPLAPRDQRALARLEGELRDAAPDTPTGLWSLATLSKLPRPPSELPSVLPRSGSNGDASGGHRAIRATDLASSQQHEWRGRGSLDANPPRSSSRRQRPGVSLPPLSASIANVTANPRKTAQRRQARRAGGPVTIAGFSNDLAVARTRTEVLRTFFEFAGRFFEYSALFAIQGTLAEGLDARGPGASKEQVVGIGVALELPSSLSRVIASGKPTIGPLGREGLDATLLDDLQRSPSLNTLLLPVFVRNRCVLVLYADNGDTELIEANVKAALDSAPAVGSALERILLERKRAAAAAASKRSFTHSARPTEPQPVAPPEPQPAIASQQPVVVGSPVVRLEPVSDTPASHPAGAPEESPSEDVFGEEHTPPPEPHAETDPIFLLQRPAVAPQARKALPPQPDSPDAEPAIEVALPEEPPPTAEDLEVDGQQPAELAEDSRASSATEETRPIERPAVPERDAETDSTQATSSQGPPPSQRTVLATVSYPPKPYQSKRLPSVIIQSTPTADPDSAKSPGNVPAKSSQDEHPPRSEPAGDSLPEAPSPIAWAPEPLGVEVDVDVTPPPLDIDVAVDTASPIVSVVRGLDATEQQSARPAILESQISDLRDPNPSAAASHPVRLSEMRLAPQPEGLAPADSAAQPIDSATSLPSPFPASGTNSEPEPKGIERPTPTTPAAAPPPAAADQAALDEAEPAEERSQPAGSTLPVDQPRQVAPVPSPTAEPPAQSGVVSIRPPHTVPSPAVDAPSSAESTEGEAAESKPPQSEPTADSSTSGPLSRDEVLQPEPDALVAPEPAASTVPHLTRLIERLCDGDRDAAQQVAGLGHEGMLEMLRHFPGPVITERAGPSSRASDCGPLLQALANVGSPAIPQIAQFTQSEDANVRRWATLLLGELPGPLSCRSVIERLGDDSPRVHQAALDAGRLLLQSTGAGQFRRTLFEVAEHPETPNNLKLRILEHVAKLQDGASVPRLVCLLAVDSDQVRHKVLWALTVVTRHDFGRNLEQWNQWWKDHQSEHRIEWLIHALDSSERRLRKAAGQDLRKETNESYGFDPDQPSEERQQAQRLYRQWWKTLGTRRFGRL